LKYIWMGSTQIPQQEIEELRERGITVNT